MLFVGRLLLPAFTRLGLAVARHRVLRARTLRWAVGMPLVTIALMVALMGPAGDQGGRRRP